MKNYICKYCGSTFDERRKHAGHTTWCEKGPNRQKNLESLEKKREKAFATNQQICTRICKWCSSEVESTGRQYQNHVRWCEKNPSREEYIETLRNARSSRTEEDLEKMRVSIRKAHVAGKYKTSYESRRGKPGPKHSEETKKLLSEKRKKFLAENPDKHPWKSSKKFESHPCEKLKTLLRDNGISFQEEHTPLSERHYSIDIAFLDKKLGIEVNGEQHYNRDRTLSDYYKERHEILESHGWKILEIHYALCYKPEVLDVVKRFIDVLSP